MQQPIRTVGDLVKALQKMDQNAVPIWAAPGATVGAAITGALRPTKVSELNGEHYTLLGPDRAISAVLIDTAP